MSTRTSVGSFAQPAATGNQAVTGVGFKPAAILFWGNSATADGSNPGTTQGVWFFGMAVSSSSRMSISLTQNATTSSICRQDNSKCINLVNATPAVIMAADLVSFDSDGFTVNWTTADATARIVNFMALGGSDITAVSLQQLSMATGTGNTATTGVGFKPDLLILASMSSAVSPPNNVTTFTAFMLSVVTATAQKVGAEISTKSAASQNTVQQTSVINIPSGGALATAATLTSLDSDGFTLNYGTVSSAFVYWALCIKGPRVAVGAFNQPGATGNQSTTGVGFLPTGLLLFSINQTSSTSVRTPSRMSLGAASSPTARGCIWMGTSSTPTGATYDLDRTGIIKMLTETTPTLNADADLVSFDGDGFTLNWSTADGTAREVAYLAFGSSNIGTPFLSKTPIRPRMFAPGLAR